MSRIIREAKSTDMAAIMQVMDAAKNIMRQSGNMHQWGDGYPSEAVISSDIEKNGGFVIVDGSKIVGYFAFLPSPEPTYEKIFVSSAASWTSALPMITTSASTPIVTTKSCATTSRSIALPIAASSILPMVTKDLHIRNNWKKLFD